MKYNIDWVINELEQEGSKVKFLHFWGHQPSPDGQITASCLSQWWNEHPFEYKGITYYTAEHYMMAGKASLFQDTEILAKIIESKHPDEAKKLGRMVRNFDQNIWEQNCQKIVANGNFLKFSQHKELEQFLLNTNERIIVEASPRDRIWGIGMSKSHEHANNPNFWRGKNLLGFCLMEVRDLLKQN